MSKVDDWYQIGCTGAPVRTGWRDPGYIHTSFMKELWPNAMYVTFYTSACY